MPWYVWNMALNPSALYKKGSLSTADHVSHAQNSFRGILCRSYIDLLGFMEGVFIMAYMEVSKNQGS